MLDMPARIERTKYPQEGRNIWRLFMTNLSVLVDATQRQLLDLFLRNFRVLLLGTDGARR